MASRELLHAFEGFAAQERRWWCLPEQGVGVELSRLRVECRGFLAWDTRSRAPADVAQTGPNV
eukprot:10484216-Alexandrium_andersonii.AAC.1